MQLAEYQARSQQAAQLVESGNHEAALAALQELVGADLPDLDKSMMLLNIATVCDKMRRSDLALAAYDKAIAVEQAHNRFFALEAKAAYLAQAARRRESLELYEQLLRRSDLILVDRERILHNIRSLQA